MKQNTSMIIREFNGGYNLELSNKKKNMSFSSCYDFSIFLGLDINEIKDIVKGNYGNILEIDLNFYNEYSYRDKDNKIEIIHFESKDKCLDVMNIFYTEKKISSLLEKVRVLEKKYNSKEEHTRDDLKACYEDDYILSIWNIERYTEESGEGFLYFDDFLLEFIEQNLIFE